MKSWLYAAWLMQDYTDQYSVDSLFVDIIIEYMVSHRYNTYHSNVSNQWVWIY